MGITAFCVDGGKMEEFFKSIVDEDKCAVVICDANHQIVYMNPAAVENYKKHGGSALVGKSIMDCHNEKSCEMIKKVVDWFREDATHGRIHTFYNEKQKKDVYMVPLRDDTGAFLGYYEKHEYRDRDKTPFYGLSGN